MKSGLRRYNRQIGQTRAVPIWRLESLTEIFACRSELEDMVRRLDPVLKTAELEGQRLELAHDVDVR